MTSGARNKKMLQKILSSSPSILGDWPSQSLSQGVGNEITCNKELQRLKLYNRMQASRELPGGLLQC